MPTRWETFPIKFEGGLITNLGRIEQGIQAPGSATVLQNFEPDVQGGYTRILGYNKFSDTEVGGSGQVRGVVALSGTEVLAERGGAFYYSTGTTWTSKLSLTNSAINRIHKDHYNFNGTEYTVVVDGVNAPAYFNHTTKGMAYAVSPPSDVVGASKVREFKNHLFFVKGPNLVFTAPYTDQDFSAANGAGIINVGDDIKGIIVFRNELIIFGLNTIHRLSGNTSSDFVLQPIAKNTGALCGFTVQEVGGDIMYLGPDGIRFLSATERNNDFGMARASEKIQKQVLDIANTDCRYATITVSGKNQYRLFSFIANTARANSNGFLATKFSNQSVDRIDWATLKGFKIYDIDKYQDRDREYIYFASDDGYIYRMEAGSSFDGEEIEAIFETPYMPITDPKFRKTIYKHTLYARPAGTLNLTCRLKFDYNQTNASQSPAFSVDTEFGAYIYGSPTTLYGTAVYGSLTQEQYYNNTVGSGFVVAVRYYNNSTDPSFNLNFAVLEYRQNERR